MPDNRLTGLDLMRALACLLVFAHHTVQRLNFGALSGGWRPFYLFFNMGAFGVGVFFLLSGFLLARPFWVAYDARQPMPSLATYALRRAARIMPGYYLSLTVTLVLAATVFNTPVTGEIVLRFVSGLAFLNAFHWLTLFPAEINGPLWSIGMEVASYALLPIGLLALFALRPVAPGWRGRLVFCAVVAAALLGHWLWISFVPKAADGVGFDHGMVGGAKFWMPNFNVAGFFLVFAIGSLTAGLSTLWRGGRTVIADAVVVAGLVVAAMAMWSVSQTHGPEAFGWLGLPYNFPFFHLGVAAALLAFPHTRLLPAVSELAPIRYIAKISSGIYIWHFLVLELIRQNFVPNFGYGGIANTSQWMELTGVSLVLAIAAGSLSSYGVEFPVLHWARQFERSRTRVVAPSAPPQNMHA